MIACPDLTAAQESVDRLVVAINSKSDLTRYIKKVSVYVRNNTGNKTILIGQIQLPTIFNPASASSSLRQPIGGNHGHHGIVLLTLVDSPKRATGLLYKMSQSNRSLIPVVVPTAPINFLSLAVRSGTPTIGAPTLGTPIRMDTTTPETEKYSLAESTTQGIFCSNSSQITTIPKLSATSEKKLIHL